MGAFILAGLKRSSRLLKKAQPLSNRPAAHLVIAQQMVRDMKELVELSYKKPLNLSSPQVFLGKIVQGLTPICDEGIEMFSTCARQMLATKAGGYSILELGSDSAKYAAFEATASPEVRQVLCEKIQLLICEGAKLIGARQYARHDRSPGLQKTLALIPTLAKFAPCAKPSAIQAPEIELQALPLRSVPAGKQAPRPAGIYLDDESKRRGMNLEVFFQGRDGVEVSFFSQRNHFV